MCPVDNENWYNFFTKGNDLMILGVSNLIDEIIKYLTNHLDMAAIVISIFAFILSLISFIYMSTKREKIIWKTN